MQYVILIPKEPFFGKVDAQYFESFDKVAKEIVRRGDEEAYLEMVTPRLFEGRYGFMMDESAVQYQPELNHVATIAYNYPDPLSDDWHAIMGPAVVGKVVQDDYDGGYRLDFLTDDEAAEVIRLIEKAIQSVRK